MRNLILTIMISSFIFLSGCASAPLQDYSESSEISHLLYKRIPYKVEGNYRVMDMFYATARKMKDKKNLPVSFRPELAKETSYGTVVIKIDPSLTIAKMLPRWYKKTGLVGVQKVEPLDESVFMKQLAEAVKESPHKSVFINVFGYKDNFEYTAIKASCFAYLIDIDTPVLMFDWPGDQSITPGGYFKAEALAAESGVLLGKLMAKIIREIKPERVWIEGSSLGCQVVCSAFEEMYKYEDLSDEEVEINHVILAAPDVRTKEFDEQFKKELTALSKNLTTYVSSNDQALLLSSILDGQKKLGRQKMDTAKHAQFEEFKDLLYLKSLSPDRIQIVDVTPINRASYMHGYYLEAPEFFDDFYLRIFEKPPHVNRRLYLIEAEDGTDHWILRSGRN